MTRIYRLIILTDGKPKGMTVASEEACTLEEMKASAISRFNAERVISVTEK